MPVMDLDLFVISSAAVVIAGMIGWMISSLAELHRKIDNLQGDMGDLRGEIGDLRGEMGGLRGDTQGSGKYARFGKICKVRGDVG